MRARSLTLTTTLLCGLAATPARAQVPAPAEAVPAPAPAAAAVPAPMVVAQAAPAEPAPVVVAQAATAAAAEVKTTAAKPAAKSPSLVEALIGGKPSASMRYRYEYLDRDDLPLHARLSTLRLALGYETKPLYGFSVMGEFEGVTSIGTTDWRIPTNDAAHKHNLSGSNARRPLAADPVGNELNQAMLKYTSSWLTAKIGRQNLPLNNARFISFSGWRQANQTLDAANFDFGPFAGLNINYIFINQANRVVGHDALDGQLEMSTHVGNVTYKKPGLINVAVFDLYLDYNELPVLVNAMGAPMTNMMTGQPVRLADGSTNSVGVRIEGPFKINDSWGIPYALDFAHQREIGDNPLEVSANYYGAEAGIAYKGLGLRVQYNVREGTSNAMTGEAFQTPLSHPWDGWTENFLRTPKTGLRLIAAHLGGPVPGVNGLTLTTAFFEYFAEKSAADGSIKAGDHYGRELDAGLEYRFLGLDKNWMIGARIAYYTDDKLAPGKIPLGAANLRTSAYTMYAF